MNLGGCVKEVNIVNNFKMVILSFSEMIFLYYHTTELYEYNKSTLTVTKLSICTNLTLMIKTTIHKNHPWTHTDIITLSKNRPSFLYMFNVNMFVLILFCISQDLSNVWPSDHPCHQHSECEKALGCGKCLYFSGAYITTTVRFSRETVQKSDCSSLWGGDTLRACWGSTSCKVVNSSSAVSSGAGIRPADDSPNNHTTGLLKEVVK